MALKPVVSKSEHAALPEVIRAEYVADGDNFKLSVDGMVTKAEHDTKIGEFRNTNITVMRERDDLRTKFSVLGDEDPTKVAATLKDIKEGRLVPKDKAKPGTEDLTAQIQSAVDAATAPLKTQITGLETKVTTEQSRADEAILRSEVTTLAPKKGVQPGAVSDLERRIKDAGFKVKDGVIVAVNTDGTPKYDPNDATKQLTVDAFISGLSTNAESVHLFTPSGGGGAANTGEKKGPTQVLRNPTAEQMGEHMADIAAGKIQVVRD